MPLSSSTSDESKSLLTEVQATALFVAYIRNLESQKKEEEGRLVFDPYAQVLLDQMDPDQRYIQKWNQSPEMIQSTLDVVAIRTRVIDEWLLLPTKTSSTTVVRQIVNLGAGLCCRPYRLKEQHDSELWKYFEIESDRSILDWKRSILSDLTTTLNNKNNNNTEIINVQADLLDLPGLSSALIQAGFDTRLPTDWIAEGLFSYIPVEHHEPLLAALYSLSSSSSLSSRIILSNVQPEFQQHATRCGVDFPHAGRRTNRDMIHALRSTGWYDNITVWEDRDLEIHYGRTMPLPVSILAAQKSQ